MNKLENNDSCILNFSSINEMLQYAGNSSYSSREIWAFGTDTECNTRTKTYNLLRSGKGLSTVRKLSKKYRQELQCSDLGNIMNRVKSIKRKRVFNDFCGNLDFDRVMSGDPNYWEKVERNGKAKVVRIGINFAISHNNSLMAFSRLVALSAVFAELLENIGYGVEIYATALYKNDKIDKTKIHNFLINIRYTL